MPHGSSDARTSAAASTLVQTINRLPKVRQLGWGFLVAWGTLSTFTGVLTDSSPRLVDLYWLFNMASTTLCLLILASLHRKPINPDDVSSGRTMCVASLSIVVSTLAMVFVRTGSPVGIAVVEGLAGALSGMGMALGTMCWACHYARLDAQEIETRAIFSALLMLACYGLGVAVDRALTVVLLVLLPLCSLVSYVLCVADDLGDGSVGSPGVLPTSSGGRDVVEYRDFLRVGLGVVASALAISSLWSLLGSGALALSSRLFTVSLFSGTVVAVALVVYCVTFSNRITLGVLYRWVVPLVAVALVLFSWGERSGLMFAGASCAFAAQMGLDVFCLIYLCELAKRYPGSGAVLIALGRAFLQGGIFLGSLFVRLLQPSIALGEVSVMQILLLLAAMVACSAAVSNARTNEGPMVGGEGVLGGADDDAARREPKACADQPAPDADAEELARRLIDSKCLKVAQTYALTRREQEVLGYLARGRSLPFIRNELYISKSTASRHVEHIYAKLDVHSRGDLISLVENTQV